MSSPSTEDLYQMSYNEVPDEMKLYYNYLDVEERKQFTAVVEKESGIILADFKGDRAILDSGRLVTAPYFYRDNVWLDWDGESMRFEMDLEERLMAPENDDVCRDD